MDAEYQFFIKSALLGIHKVAEIVGMPRMLECTS